MNTKQLIKIFENLATLLEIKGENPFKSRAYRNAIKTIKSGHFDIEKAAADDTLKEIEGFEDAISKKIKEFIETGKITAYEKIKEELPESLVTLTKVNHIGTKRAADLFNKYGIKSIEELEIACLDGILDHAKGFSKTNIEEILTSIEFKKASRGRYNQEEALSEAYSILEFIKSLPEVQDADLTGNVRRFTETLDEINIIISTHSKDFVIKTLKEKFKISQDREIISAKTHGGFPVSFYIETPENYFYQLHQTTGNEEYLFVFDEFVEKKEQSGALITNFSSEEELYSKLKLQYVPPELRESPKALIAAQNNQIPKLIEYNDLKGMLHVHSNWSDGEDSIADMAIEARNLGFEYIAICDHSQTPVYANGLKPDRIMKQHEEIDKLNNSDIGIKILKGIESDILKDGSLDYPDEILASFDLVVASIHAFHKMTKEEMTHRVIKALENPYTTILGHPTGRLLLVRQPYEIDIKAVIDAAAANNKVIEINANAYRLDLDWRNVIYAKEKGVKIAINPDSHRASTMSDVYYGIKVARKGWLEAKDVINSLCYEEFMRFLSKY